MRIEQNFRLQQFSKTIKIKKIMIVFKFQCYNNCESILKNQIDFLTVKYNDKKLFDFSN